MFETNNIVNELKKLYITESLCYMSETDTTFYINYTSIQKKKKNKPLWESVAQSHWWTPETA